MANGARELCAPWPKIARRTEQRSIFPFCPKVARVSRHCSRRGRLYCPDASPLLLRPEMSGMSVLFERYNRERCENDAESVLRYLAA